MACPSPSAEFSDLAAGDNPVAYQLQPTSNPILEVAPKHIFDDSINSSLDIDRSLGGEPNESEDDDTDEDAFSTVSLKDIDTLVAFYETLLKHSVNTDAFHAISKVTLDLKDLKLCHNEYPKDMQATLGDRLYLAAQLTDYCIVCLSLVPHHENLFLKIRCPTCQAVEFCSGFCSLEQNTHPCRLLSKLRVMSRCKDTYIDTYRDRKNMVIERANMLEAHHAEALALDAQKEELIRRRGVGEEITNLPESNAELVLTESDQYILNKLQPVCNILGLTRKLYTKKDQVFLKELAESSFTIADLRVKDPFTYAFILKIAFLFSGGMAKVQQEKDKLASVLTEIRKMSAEFDFNYSFLHQTLTDLKKIMLTASNEATDLASIQSVYQACRNTLSMTGKIKLPEQCQAALNDIRKVVYFWNEIRMSNHLIDALNRYYDFVKGINLHEARKKQLQQESANLTDQIKECQENIVEVKQATLELQARLDKLKVGIFPSSGPSPAEDTGSTAVSAGGADAKQLSTVRTHGSAVGASTAAHNSVADSLLKEHNLSALSNNSKLLGNVASATRTAAHAQTSVIEGNTSMLTRSQDPDALSRLKFQSDDGTLANRTSYASTNVLPEHSNDTHSVLMLSTVDVEHGETEESGNLQKQGGTHSKGGLDNLLSFSDVVVSINDIMSTPTPPQLPSPPPHRVENLSEGISAEPAPLTKRSILEQHPPIAPSFQCDDSPEIPHLGNPLRISQAPLLDRSLSKSIPDDVPLNLTRPSTRSVNILPGADDIIASESDPLRLATIARSTISKPQMDTCKSDNSSPSTRSSTSDHVLLKFNEEKNWESTTMQSPTFGAELQESTGTTLQKQQNPAHDQELRIRESSNLHVVHPKSLTDSMLTDRERSSEADRAENVSAIHIVPPKPPINTFNKATEEGTDMANSCIRNSTTSVTTVINQYEARPATGRASAKMEVQTDTNAPSQTTELELSSLTSLSTQTDGQKSYMPTDTFADPPRASGQDSKHRSLSNRYRDMHAKLVRQRSIFDNIDGASKSTSGAHGNEDKLKKSMHISSIPKNLLDLSVTAENTNILARFSKPPNNPKLNQVVHLNPQKVSRYLDDLTTSMYTTEVIFLAKVWKIMARGLLLLGRINSYYSKKAAALGETYVDRIIGTHEQRFVKRAYETILNKLINTKFEYHSYIKLCQLRFNMSIGTAKNCKWKSSDDVLKFSLTEDQYKRLKQANALRVNTEKMSTAQRKALYTSLKNYIMDGTEIDPNEVLRAS
ncbi:Hypothetical protein GLP15_2157 [Giardia lamblia P15]|uniref:Uncharacterized protein n=1 Tax=Giardia intestinalis (strain P15) TaxID=658858 RepID=E1F6Z1_GIAIA|nr:Hypothetical protein GLP15_2157 [Giardia lamblia P15]